VPPAIISGPTASGKFALTFDMGSVGGSTAELLDVLKKHGVRATFFVTGKWSEDNPAVLKAIVAAGHEVANHSYSHPDFRKIKPEAMAEELDKTESTVKRIAGVSTRPYWRPPLGSYDDTVLRVVHENGYRTVYWTVDTDDWRNEATTASIVTRTVKGAKAGGIVLMHGALKKTVRAVPEIIAGLRAKGLQPTSLSDLLESP
jgi:peptidoglycan/xylan/chitin deacetylase (PgdA/CDA1 family)